VLNLKFSSFLANLTPFSQEQK